MIDFQNPEVIKLRQIAPDKISKHIEQILIEDEEVIQAFKTVRDQVVFTDKRIIAVNMQGMTGTKVDYTSLPYRKIQCFSVETPGVLDMDCELQVWFGSLGKVAFEFLGNADIRSLSKAIARYILD